LQNLEQLLKSEIRFGKINQRWRDLSAIIPKVPDTNLNAPRVARKPEI
jgi:hypothetical protein